MAATPGSPTPSAAEPSAEAVLPKPTPPSIASGAFTPPQRSVVTFHRVEDVVRGSAQPAKRLDVNAPIYHMQFGPDPRWAVTLNLGERTPLRLLDLESGVITSIALNVPADALHPGSAVRWFQDGRLLLTGREVWIGGPRGEDLRSVFAEFPLVVVPSPSGRRLAIIALGRSDIVVLDLAARKTTTLIGPFRPCVQDGGVPIAWAPDERTIAATDCSDQAQGGMQTRFVRVADDQEIRTLPALTTLAWLPSGHVIARAPFGKRDGSPGMWIVAPDGTRRPIPAWGFMPSPDGRFLLGSGVRDAATSSDPARREHFAQLVDLATGRVLDVGEGMPVGWTSRGEIVLVTLF